MVSTSTSASLTYSLKVTVFVPLLMDTGVLYLYAAGWASFRKYCMVTPSGRDPRVVMVLPSLETTLHRTDSAVMIPASSTLTELTSGDSLYRSAFSPAFTLLTVNTRSLWYCVPP